MLSRASRNSRRSLNGELTTPWLREELPWRFHPRLLVLDDPIHGSALQSGKSDAKKPTKRKKVRDRVVIRGGQGGSLLQRAHHYPSKGFPGTFSSKCGSTKPKESLFMQSLRKKRGDSPATKVVTPPAPNPAPAPSARARKRDVLKPVSAPLRDMRAISDDNDKRIQRMSREEIERARKEIEDNFSPDIVRRLLSLNAAPRKTSPLSTANAIPRAREHRDKNLAWIQNDDDLGVASATMLSEAEKEKLKWFQADGSGLGLGGGEEEKDEEGSRTSSDRVDLDGHIITDKDVKELGLPLYHHGKEPTKPGYTMEELCILLRSSVRSQRLIALQTVTRVLKIRGEALMRGGEASGVVKILPKELGLILRMALDDDSILARSICALRIPCASFLRGRDPRYCHGTSYSRRSC